MSAERNMCVTKKQCTCSLVLEDGTVFTGESFGAKVPVDGEVGKLILRFVVFLFDMRGYYSWRYNSTEQRTS